MANMDLKIGDTIYRFDSNRRKYSKPHSGPDFEYHFEPRTIEGETKLSWLIGRPGRDFYKVNKRTLRTAILNGFASYQFYTEDGMKVAVWLDENRRHLVKAIESADYETLRAVDALMNKGA